jgi:hypothetical protein
VISTAGVTSGTQLSIDHVGGYNASMSHLKQIDENVSVDCAVPFAGFSTVLVMIGIVSDSIA